MESVAIVVLTKPNIFAVAVYVAQKYIFSGELVGISVKAALTASICHLGAVEQAENIYIIA